MKCISGSATPKNIRPMPMPAENIMAIQETPLELGLFVVAAQRDRAVSAERKPEYENHKPRPGQHEQPTRVVHDPRQCIA